MTATHSLADLQNQWDHLRLDLEDLNRKHDQLSISEYGGHFDDIVQALGHVEAAIQQAPANDWQTVLVKLHVAVGLAQDQVGEPDKHDHPFVELLRTVTRDVGRLAGGGAAMTEDRKEDMSGLADVSAKFVDEAEATVEAAASTDEALSDLWQEYEQLRQQYTEAIEETDRTFVLIPDEVAAPGYHATEEANKVAERHQQEVSDAIVATENRMAKVPARTVAGALLKLRVAGSEIAGELKDHDGVLDETQGSSEERLVLSALADLERLADATAVKE